MPLTAGPEFYVPKGAVVPAWWTCPLPGDTVEFYWWCTESRPPIQVEERMGRAAARYLACGHSPARTRKFIAWKFPAWALLAGELVDAVLFAAEGRP